jgi:dipeptidase E
MSFDKSSIPNQVICLGGGGCDGSFIDFYILAQAQKPDPKVCLLPTASADNPNLIQHFHTLMERCRAIPDYLPLFSPGKVRNIRSFLLEQDIIYITGGNSKVLMGVIKEYGVDTFLREANENGTIIAGGSAGSVAFFNQCLSDAYGGLDVIDALGWLPYSTCPHYSSKARRQAFKANILSGALASPGYANADNAALHFVDGKLLRCVSSRPSAKCYEARRNEDGTLFHSKLPTFFLGDQKYQRPFIFESDTFAHLIRQDDDEEDEDNSVQHEAS